MSDQGRTESERHISKAQAGRDVDRALGVTRTGRHMPMVEGLNSFGSRFAIRLAYSVRYHGQFPADVVIATMAPPSMRLGERLAVIERIRHIAEREGWWSE